MKEDKSKIGEIFRDALSDYQIEPSQNVWKAIEESPHLPKGSGFNPFSPKNLIIAATAIVLIAFISIFSFNYFSDDNHEVTETIDKKVVRNISADNKLPVNTGLNQISELKTEPETVVEKEKSEFPVRDPKALEVNQKPLANTIVEDNHKNNTKKESGVAVREKSDILRSNINSGLRNIENASTYNESNVSLRNDVSDKNTENKNDTNTSGTPVITYSADQKICRGESATIAATGGSTYLWSNGEISDTLIISPEMTTVYRITVTDNESKKNYGEIVVIVVNCSPLFIPNAFTPNGDGINDYFKATGTGVREFNMKIVSRSGHLVFESNDINDGWDGRFKGNYAIVGDYLFQIRYVDENNEPRILKGKFTLL